MVGEDEQANARGKLVEEPDTQAEDVSDGISIISDCESTGRISPHPFLREHLNELNFKYDSGHELPLLGNLPEDIAVQQIHERRRVQLELDDALRTQTASPVVRPQSELSQPTQRLGYRLPTLVESGLTAVFYVGATLAILAFISRLRNPEWQALGGDKPIAELEQRLVELELQNNLMRAEIDIMSKQLQYLSSLAGSGQGQAQAQSQSQGRRAKTFKAWPGNGNSVDPVDITKADLKRPYKCPDGQYVEIAAMCMENKPHAESLADEIGNVVNDVLQQSQAFHNFEKVTERLGTLAGQKDAPSDSPKTYHAHGEKMRPPPLDNNSRGPVPVHVPQPTYDTSKERYTTKHNHKRREHSRERNRYKSSEHDSKERHNRKHADKSKEERGKKRHGGHDNDSGSGSGSGEWHERMMQHREQSRQRHEQKRNNNWYIERGGSREQIRSGETRRR
nr:uncharacterized protein LOC6636687 [Drosophila virilis]